MADDVLTRDFLRAWNAHDPDAAVALMTEDCVFEPSVGPYPWGDRLHGRQELHAWALETFRKIPDIRWDPIRSTLGANHAVFEFRVTGTRGPRPFEVHTCDILTLRHGLISAKRAYRKARQ